MVTRDASRCAKAAAPDGVYRDTFRGLATARLELRRSKVGRGPRGRHLPARRRRRRFTSAPRSALSLGSARRCDAAALASTRRVAPVLPARRRGCGTRPAAAPSAPLNFFCFPEPRAEGSAELGRRLGGVAQGTPMGSAKRGPRRLWAVTRRATSRWRTPRRRRGRSTATATVSGRGRAARRRVAAGLHTIDAIVSRQLVNNAPAPIGPGTAHAREGSNIFVCIAQGS